MAKYTELLSEYLEHGGQLPAVFSDIEGFTDLFIGKYIDHEIGFETPVIFQIKLNQRANIVFPAYLKRKVEIENIEQYLTNPNKKHVKTGDLTRSRSGEIIHTQSPIDQSTTNTKNGTITETDETKGKTTPGDTYNRQWDLPIAADITAGSELDIAPTSVTRNTPSPSETTNTNTHTENYTNYSDTAHSITQENTNTESFNDYYEIEDYNNITEAEMGLTATEALAIKTHIKENIDSMLQELLNEFTDLFMKVY